MEEESSEAGAAQGIRARECRRPRRQLGLQTGAQERRPKRVKGRLPRQGCGARPGQVPLRAAAGAGEGARDRQEDRGHGAHVTTHLPPTLSGGPAGKAREGQVALSSLQLDLETSRPLSPPARRAPQHSEGPGVGGPPRREGWESAGSPRQPTNQPPSPRSPFQALTQLINHRTHALDFALKRRRVRVRETRGLTSFRSDGCGLRAHGQSRPGTQTLHVCRARDTEDVHATAWASCWCNMTMNSTCGHEGTISPEMRVRGRQSEQGG